MQYNRDVQGRLTKRRSFTISNWNWTETVAAQSNYGYTASGDSPDFVKDNSGTIVEKYLTLPGDVLLTIRPTEPDSQKQKTYSLPNIHGDIFATTNTSGIVQGTFTAGPFGESLNITGSNQTQPVIAHLANQPNSNNPNNTRTGTSYDYVGQHQKLTETSLALQPMQMGARVYIPALGRFLAVDPQQGGTENNYAYVSDPVNDFDLDGTFSAKNWLKEHRQGIAQAGKTFATVSIAIGLASCVVATAGACAAVGVGLAAAGGAMKTAERVSQGNSWRDGLKSGGKSFAIDGALSFVSFAKPVRSMSKLSNPLKRTAAKSTLKSYYGGARYFSISGAKQAFKTSVRGPKNKALVRYGAGMYTAWGVQWVSEKSKQRWK
ncbi:hypothetical protein JNM87_00425 [Candidatus Saccharibacteria bacterium]|nr:hypothetical protein [Candidatus Saccharibacteria bacterium]